MELRKDFKSSEVGQIPADWKLMALVDLAEIRSGIAKNSNAAVTNPVFVHYLRVANVQDGFLDLTEMSQLQVSRHDIKRYAVLPGDMLMNEGGDLDKLGRGALWSGEFSPCVHQNHVFVVRCGSSLLPTYLKAWTGSTAARKYFLLAGRQTTNLASINKTSLGLLPVPLPSSRAEQEAIAEALSNADALIESLDQLIAKKRQVKQGAMQELLTGKRRLPGFVRKWELRALGEIAPLQRGFDLPNSRLKPGSYPVVASNGVLNHHSTFQVKGPGVVTGRSGTIGVVTFVEENFWPHNTSLWVTSFRANEPKFVFYLYARIGLERFSTGSGVPTLNRNDVHAFKVEIPVDKDEQAAIATVLSDMDTELAALESRLAKARQIKQGMMQELLTGRIRLL